MNNITINTRTKNALPGADDIARTVLPNGITLLVRENFAAKSIVISGLLPVGAIDETPDQIGIASWVGSSLMRGTAAHTFDQIHELLESNGATLSIGAGTFNTSFGGKSLAEDLPILLDLLNNALRAPDFPVDQTERLRGEMLTSIGIRQGDTNAVTNEAFRHLLYPDWHIFRRDNMAAEAASLPHLTFDDLRAFHRARFTPNGMIIVIVGAITHADALRLVSATFGDWTGESHRVMLPRELDSSPITRPAAVPRADKPLPGKSQSSLMLGWIGPRSTAPDYRPALIANSIWGQFGMMGRLGKVIREEQGLAYSCSSRISGGLADGPWYVAAGVNPANVGRALESILIEANRLVDEPVSESELDDVKANYIGRLPLSLESNEGVAGSILNMEIYVLGLDYLRHYADIFGAITREQVQAAAQRYIYPAAYALAVGGAAV